MKCADCDTPMVSTNEAYKYSESGLPNVTLVGIEVRRCPHCGEQAAAIPRVMQLHQILAQSIVRKRARLAAQEVRFLRTYLGRSTEDFAKLMGVTREQVSRWENGHNPIGAQADRLLRLLVARTWPQRDYNVEELSEIEDQEPGPLANVRIARAPNGWELGAN